LLVGAVEESPLSALAKPGRLRVVLGWKNACVFPLLRVLDPFEQSLVGAVEAPS